MSFTFKQTGRRLWRILWRVLLAACLLLLLTAAVKTGLFRRYLPQNLLPAPVEGQAGLALHMMDVGQAQALLLTCGGESALVDTGLPETGGRVADYIRRQGVRGLKYLFVTHPHSDHCGGARRMLEDVGAETLVIPEYLSPEAALVTAGDWVGSTDTQIAVTHTGEQFQLGEAVISVLHPASGNGIEDMNDLSLVLLVEYTGKRLLLTGDISREVELQLPDIGPVDVLQVPHHGSGGSSCREFLEDISPDYALISCGKNNDYGHPHDSVLERLEDVGAVVHRTDREGTLVVTVREGQITVKSENKS